MKNSLVTFVGNALERVLSVGELTNLEADVTTLAERVTGEAIHFLRGKEYSVESGLAHLLATHPALAGEFKIAEEDSEDPTGTAAGSPADTSTASTTSSVPSSAETTTGTTESAPTPSEVAAAPPAA